MGICLKKVFAGSVVAVVAGLSITPTGFAQSGAPIASATPGALQTSGSLPGSGRTFPGTGISPTAPQPSPIRYAKVQNPEDKEFNFDSVIGVINQEAVMGWTGNFGWQEPVGPSTDLSRIHMIDISDAQGPAVGLFFNSRGVTGDAKLHERRIVGYRCRPVASAPGQTDCQKFYEQGGHILHEIKKGPTGRWQFLLNTMNGSDFLKLVEGTDFAPFPNFEYGQDVSFRLLFVRQRYNNTSAERRDAGFISDLYGIGYGINNREMLASVDCWNNTYQHCFLIQYYLIPTETGIYEIDTSLSVATNVSRDHRGLQIADYTTPGVSELVRWKHPPNSSASIGASLQNFSVVPGPSLQEVNTSWTWSLLSDVRVLGRLLKNQGDDSRRVLGLVSRGDQQVAPHTVSVAFQQSYGSGFEGDNDTFGLYNLVGIAGTNIVKGLDYGRLKPGSAREHAVVNTGKKIHFFDEDPNPNAPLIQRLRLSSVTYDSAPGPVQVVPTELRPLFNGKNCPILVHNAKVGGAVQGTINLWTADHIIIRQADCK